MGCFFLMEIFHGEKKSRSFFHKQSEALGYISAVKQISGGSLDPKTQPQKRYVVEKDFFLEHCESWGDWFPSSILFLCFPRL